MKKIRRFRADYNKSDDATGIGITEHTELWNDETIAIWSIYEPKRISNQDATRVILQTIYNDLEDDEGAILQIHKFNHGRGYHKPYASRMNVQYVVSIRGAVYQPALLAGDAIERETTIIERFDEPMRFSVVQQEREERKEGR